MRYKLCWYCLYYFILFRIRKSYEHHVVDVYSYRGPVGTKNHSARFPYLFYHLHIMLLDLILEALLFQILGQLL